MLFLPIILFLISTGYGDDLLPGVDDIAAGYDAAKMLSASEQNSKYRIFDLSELSATTFKTKVLGKVRSFSAPKFVQVADISRRREETCQTVAYTFQSFFRRSESMNGRMIIVEVMRRFLVTSDRSRSVWESEFLV